MDDELIKQVRSELARQGGLARAKALTARQRRESAIKASKAAAKARTKAKKQRQGGLALAKALTGRQRRESVIKASKTAAKAPTTKPKKQNPQTEARMSSYGDIMDPIEQLPGVQADLEAVQKLGADRERVLAYLPAIVVARTSLRIPKTLRKREDALRDHAANMKSLAIRTQQVLKDRSSSASRWATTLGYRIGARLEPQNRPPTESVVGYMEACAKWLERNAEALSHLRLAYSKVGRTGGMYGLARYVRKSTGRPCTTLLARLLNAAADAIQSDESFNDDSLTKVIERHRQRTRKQSAELRLVANILKS